MSGVFQEKFAATRLSNGSRYLYLIEAPLRLNGSECGADPDTDCPVRQIEINVTLPEPAPHVQTQVEVYEGNDWTAGERVFAESAQGALSTWMVPVVNRDVTVQQQVTVKCTTSDPDGSRTPVHLEYKASSQCPNTHVRWREKEHSEAICRSVECESGQAFKYDTQVNMPGRQVEVQGGLGRCEQCFPGLHMPLAVHTSVGVATSSNGGMHKHGLLQQCEACTPGSAMKRIFRSRSCAFFFAGTFQEKASATTCKLCQPGMYTSQTLQQKCLACDPGTFSDDFGATNCTKCAPGMFQDGVTTNSTVCKPCKPGYFMDEARQKECDAQPSAEKCACKHCPLSSYNPFSQASECQKCPDDTLRDEHIQEKRDPSHPSHCLCNKGETICLQSYALD